MMAKLDRLGTREKAGLLIALVVVLGLVVDQFAVRPGMREYRSIQASIVQASADLTQNLNTIANRPWIERTYNESRQLVDAMTSPAQDIDTLKGEINKLAEANGVALNSMKHRTPQAAENGSFTRTYTVDIDEFECGMSDLLGFLDAVHRSPGMLRVARLTIEPKSQQDSSMVKGTMTVTKVVMTPEQPAQEG